MTKEAQALVERLREEFGTDSDPTYYTRIEAADLIERLTSQQPDERSVALLRRARAELPDQWSWGLKRDIDTHLQEITNEKS